MQIQLTLGNFTFNETQLEVPDTFGDLGGSQSVQQKLFPGGIITHRSYGYFPGQLSWRARFSGQYASDDVEAVKRILIAGKEVPLTYGDKSWRGRLVKFTPTVKHQWLYDYALEYWPRVDTSSGYPSQISISSFLSVLSLHITALKGLISGATSPNLLLAGLASFFLGPVSLFVDSVSGAVQESGGVVGHIDTATQLAIAKAGLAALAAAAPYQGSSVPLESSPAWDAAARIQAVMQIMTVRAPTVTTIRTINPNLPVLAAQYYNDASKWRIIAGANGLSDPMPIGVYNLTIPPDTV